MKLKFIECHNLDKERYSNCLNKSKVYSIYAEFDYLNAVANNQWGALVLNNYEAIFPIPFRKKWGISYIYNPLFCQQLGVFGNPGNLNTQDFISAIPKKFIRIHLNVHKGFGIPKFCTEKPNFILKAPLNPENTFNKDAWKNINKCLSESIHYSWDEDVRSIIKLYHQTWGSSIGFRWFNDYKGFEKACFDLLKNEKLLCLTAFKENQILAGAIFLKSDSTLHYVCAAPSDLGKKYGIMHGLIYHVAKKFPHLNLDFEGSSIASVAQFYKKFGPNNEPYCSIRRTLWWNI